MRSPIGQRKIRRDAKLLHLPREKRERIVEWVNLEGVDACRQRIQNELGISLCVRTIYLALARWEAEECFAQYDATAYAQMEMEAAERGGLTPTQREEAVDRNFIMLASKVKDTKLYQQLRYLRIADQKAKSQHRFAKAKLEQGAKNLRQKGKALELAERKVVLLEKKIAAARQATENRTLDAEERAARVREILGS